MVYPGAVVHAGSVVHTGAVLHAAVAVHAGALVYTGTVMHAGTVVYTGAVLHTAAMVYTGAVVYTGAAVHAGAVVYTGAVVQRRRRLFFAVEWCRPWVPRVRMSRGGLPGRGRRKRAWHSFVGAHFFICCITLVVFFRSAFEFFVCCSPQRSAFDFCGSFGFSLAFVCFRRRPLFSVFDLFVMFARFQGSGFDFFVFCFPVQVFGCLARCI